ncbi:MAG: hypothetical protein EON58_13465 [Alphaproteobacteria bacterium]|nr:MAG: hypothetical protein EON58_13465 [Alphaproteobacteria bacterium]
MTKIHESPLDCELGEAYFDREDIPVWEWEPVEDVHVCTLYNPGSKDTDESLLGRYFRFTRVVVDGYTKDVMVRVDPDIFPTGFPVNAPDLDGPITEELVDGKSKYSFSYAGGLRETPEECVYGDYLRREDWEDRMFWTQFHNDLYFYRLFDPLEATEASEPSPYADYVFDREERTLGGVTGEYFVRINMLWLQAVIAERQGDLPES